MKSSALANPFGLEPGGSKVPLRIAVIGALQPVADDAGMGEDAPKRTMPMDQLHGALCKMTDGAIWMVCHSRPPERLGSR
jgi:hypothetical protein